jgi:PBSX family phage terminase large subunit
MVAAAPEVITYEPRGAARDLLLRKDPELLLSGPAGTGKSRVALEKVHLCALKYPGMRALIARKTLTSLTSTGLVTFSQHVLHPKEGVTFFGGSKSEPAAYRYPNGSAVVVGGMDKPEKVMSAEYDMAYLQEATDLLAKDYEAVTTRLRNGVMPYQQLLSDCNPTVPWHWLKQRCDRGVTVELLSRHEDNPRLHDGTDWTPEGRRYLALLANLTGARKERLLYGRWAAEEGLVYEEFDAAIHVVDRFEIPASWPRYRSVDFGYTNPFSCSSWAQDPDGRLYLYRQVYRTQTLAEDHARRIVTLSEGERVLATVADHDAEDRATLERHGVPTVTAYKKITPGIQAVKARLRKAGDGKPRLFILRDSLVERDEALAQASRPLNTEQEFDSYVWAKGVDGRPNKEAPVDDNNHGLDELRYMVAYVDKITDEPETFMPWVAPRVIHGTATTRRR